MSHLILEFDFINNYVDSRDWRSHLEQMKQLRSNISTGLNGTKNQLDKLHTDIANTLDKIKMREMYLNKQLEPTLVEFRSLQVMFILFQPCVISFRSIFKINNLAI